MVLKIYVHLLTFQCYMFIFKSIDLDITEAKECDFTVLKMNTNYFDLKSIFYVARSTFKVIWHICYHSLHTTKNSFISAATVFRSIRWLYC